MKETLMRQWAILRAVPRHPRRLDAPSIRAQLADRGIDVTLRTVQRDLNALATAFPLDFDQRKPQGWCWRQGAGQLEIPSMDVHAALTFNLVEQYMQNLLPRSTLSHMAPWFDAARGVAHSRASTVMQWPDKVRVVPLTLNKIPAPIDPAIQRSIYEGLLNERQLLVTYRAITSGKEAKTYPLHPLGLVIKEQVVYLVATVKDYRDPRFLAMHRIDAAQLLPSSAIRPPTFDLDEFILKEFGIRVGTEPLNLVLRIRGVLTKYLAETPLEASQSMTPIDGQWWRLRAQAQDTIQLRTWLRSLGPDAVVESPESLKRQMEHEASELAALYASGNSAHIYAEGDP